MNKEFIIQNGQWREPSTHAYEMVVDNDNITINPEKNSKITLYVINDGTDQSLTQNITVNFQKSHAELAIFGLYRACGKQSLAITTKINHFVPHCTSNQLWKGVLSDSAKVAFEGKIIVAPHAQKTVAHLQNKNLLLSQEAEINTKPILEIEANDVQCTHGATVGFLDQEALFYLRSRGIEEALARELLIEAFVNEVTSNR